MRKCIFIGYKRFKGQLCFKHFDANNYRSIIFIYFFYFIYCPTVKSEIFANSVKTHICDVKNSQQGHDLPISVNDPVILPIREDFIFTKLRIFSRKLNLRENFRINRILVGYEFGRVFICIITGRKACIWHILPCWLLWAQVW